MPELWPTATRSMAWPPAMPLVPEARASMRTIMSRAASGCVPPSRPARAPQRQRLQGIADQDGGRLIKGAMAGRAAAAQVIVVHRRQIIVHQS